DAWRGYQDRWFRPAHACSGGGCDAKQPTEEVAGGDVLLGLALRRNATTPATDVLASAGILRSSEALNPFRYGLRAEARHRSSGGTGTGVFGLRLDLALPVGKRAAIGLTPMAWRTSFGSDGTGPELVTQLLSFQYRVGERTWLSLAAPVQFDWIK